jgi:hypothetical protein
MRMNFIFDCSFPENSFNIYDLTFTAKIHYLPGYDTPAHFHFIALAKNDRFGYS